MTAARHKDPNENRPGYKKTKVGWIPEEWSDKNLGAIVDSSQYGLSTANSEQGTIPIVGMKQIVEGKVLLESLARTNIPIAEAKDFFLCKDDLLFNRTNSIEHVGKTGIMQKSADVVFASYLVRFRIQISHACPPFVAFALNTTSARNYLRRLATPGVCQHNINQSELKKHFHLPLPPFPEQQKIAEILSTWDEAIEQTRTLIAAKKRRKKGLMQQLLTGKRRLPGFGEAWQWPRSDEHFRRVSERSCGNDPVLSATQDNGIVNRADLDKRIEYDKDNLINYKIVEPNDFVISLRSFQGGLEMSRIRGRISPAYHVIRGSTYTVPEFFRFYFKSFEFIGRLAIAVIGIRDGKQVNYDDFCFMRMPLPPLDEQKAISGVLQAADEEIACHEANLKALEKQKRGLMQKLLTGEVRVRS